MSLPIWPAILLPPLREGYQIQAGEGRRLSAEDAGPMRVQGRFSSVANAVQMTLFLTRAHLGVFDYFYEVDTKRGALPFLMLDFETDGRQLLDEDFLPLLDEDGVPLLMTETWLAMFGRGLPTRREQDLYFRVSFEIAVMP